MKIVSQRLYPVKLNKPQEHIEIPAEGTMVKFYWNIGLLTQRDGFSNRNLYRIDQLLTIEVFSYGQPVARYSSQWNLDWQNMSSLKTKDGFDLRVNDMTLRITNVGKPKERKVRGHTGKPLMYPEKIAIQRLQ